MRRPALESALTGFAAQTGSPSRASAGTALAERRPAGSRHFLIARAIGVFALAQLLAPTAPAACDPSLVQAEAVLDLHRADRALPGAALAVFDAAGTVNRERFFGSYTASTYVPLASATKSVSAAVIMSLVDDGTMSLDSTVADYFPQYAGTERGSITLRHAFSQTAGIYNDEFPCIGDGSTTLEACALDILANVPRVAAPGATFFYGGNSMHVAGRMAEIAYCRRFPANCAGLGSGAIWRRIFNERLRDPLGIGMVWTSANNPRIAGGLLSRLSDYRAFWRMIIGRGTVDGVRVLSPEAVDAMTGDQRRGARVFYSAAQPDVGYGLGIWRFDPDHDGVLDVYNDPGLYGFHPWYDAEVGLGGIVMINDAQGAGRGGGRHVATQIEAIVHERFARTTSADANADAGADADADANAVSDANAGANVDANANADADAGADADADGVCDAADLCPSVADPAQIDTDGDGAGDACDLAPANRRAWAVPGETGRAIFYPPDTCYTVSYDAQTGDITCLPADNLFDWLQPDGAGAIVTDLRWDLIRSGDPADFVNQAACEASGIDRSGPFNNRFLFAVPAFGRVNAYLARARSAGTGAGPAGYASTGAEIAARACP